MEKYLSNKAIELINSSSSLSEVITLISEEISEHYKSLTTKKEQIAKSRAAAAKAFSEYLTLLTGETIEEKYINSALEDMETDEIISFLTSL